MYCDGLLLPVPAHIFISAHPRGCRNAVNNFSCDETVFLREVTSGVCEHNCGHCACKISFFFALLNIFLSHRETREISYFISFCPHLRTVSIQICWRGLARTTPSCGNSISLRRCDTIGIAVIILPVSSCFRWRLKRTNCSQLIVSAGSLRFHNGLGLARRTQTIRWRRSLQIITVTLAHLKRPSARSSTVETLAQLLVHRLVRTQAVETASRHAKGWPLSSEVIPGIEKTAPT